MKKVVLFLFATVMLVTSCVDKEAFTITGKLPNTENDGQEVYLQAVGETWKDRVNVDTAVIEQGKFEFKGLAKNGIELRFVSMSDPTGGVGGNALVVVEPGKISIGMGSTASVGGTPKNEEYKAFLESTNKYKEDGNDVLLRQEVFDFAKSNIDNKLGEYIFSSNSYMFSLVQLKDLAGSVGEEYKASAAGQKITNRIAALDATDEGKKYTDLKAMTPGAKPKPIALSNYVGKSKYVLVDFWASWCPPCRRDMPIIANAYARYKKQGLEIVGVSLDDDKTKWEEGLKDLSMVWPQMSDLKGWDSELAKTYGIASIPHTLIIDKQGNIIARGVAAKELLPKLDELFKKK